MSFEYTTPAIEKWKLDDFMMIVDDFEDEFADTVHHKVYIDNDYRTVLLHIVGKSLVTAREILTLCAHGYPDGALSIGRNLYEQMIIVSFFEMHKNDEDFQGYVDDFFLSYNVQRNKCLRAIDKYLPESNISELDTEWEKLRKRTTRKLCGDYWWTGYSSFSDLVNHVMAHQTDSALQNFLGIHYMRYKRACVSLHAGCMGNSSRVGSNTDFNVVDTAPTVCGQSTPLVYASVSLITIIGLVCTNFQIESAKYLESLNKLAIFYQKQEREDTTEIHKMTRAF